MLLGLHIAAGSLGLLLGPLVIWRGTRRVRAGERGLGVEGAVYNVAVLAVCVSAIALVVRQRPDLGWLIAVAAVSYALVVMAQVVVAQRFAGWSHAFVHGLGGSYIALVTALVVVALTLDGPLKTGAVQVIPWVAPAAIGTPLILWWRRRFIEDEQRGPRRVAAGRA